MNLNTASMLLRWALCAAVLTGTAASHAATTYKLTDLGTLGEPSWALSFGSSINNAGQVTGGATNPYASYCRCIPYQAFLYSDGVMTTLSGMPKGAHSYGNDINDAGQITGWGWAHDTFGRHAFVYSDGVMTDLSEGEGSGINHSGQITGYYFPTGNSPFNRHAFLSSGRVQTDLGTLGGSESVGSAINNAGQITGSSSGRAFIYSDGVMTNLGVLGETRGSSWSHGNDINDSGQIVGASTIGSSAHAFLYSAGAMIDLGSLSGQSEGLGINNSGQVTGWYYTDGTGDQKAFLYSDGVMTDLETLLDQTTGLGWQLSSATDINDAGQIVANGYKEGVGSRALLLSPIPEPSTYALMVAGLCALGVTERRRYASRVPAPFKF